MVSIVVTLACQTSLLKAAEYRLGAEFSPTFSYDDNVLLREEEEGSFQTQIQPTLILTRAEANSSLSLRSGLRVERYTELSDLDREDPFTSFSGSYNTERSAYGLTAGYSERAQRSIAEEDTGDFSSNATVESTNVSPSYQYQLTEQDFIYTSFNYSERKYSSDSSDPLDDASNLNDNTTKSLTTGWRRNLTERLTGGLALTYAEYESESQLRESNYDTYNFAVTSSYLFTEKWSISGQFGYRTLENEIIPVSGPKLTDKTTGTLFSFSANYAGELNDFSLTLGRSLNPSGEGVVNEQDRLAINWRRALTEKLSFGLNTTYQQTQTADDINTTDRDYFFISPTMNWKLKSNLALNFGYQYREQKSTNSEAIDSNMVFITLDYNWDGLRFSR